MPEVLVLVELEVVALLMLRCCNALFCEVAVVPREELLLWNIFCSTDTACCGSPFFIWKT